MKKTVLITGTSSGIGKAAALYFAQKGWNVAATMRSPEKDSTFGNVANVKVYALDVTKPETIDAAIAAVIRDFGRLDAVVNNAGFGVDGIFEAMSDEVIQRQFDTNVFGLMRVTRSAIQAMRQQKEGGTIIQISSMGGRVAFPAYSIYHSTKWAVEGLSESLQYELQAVNIKMKIVEPGSIKTEFLGSSRQFVRPPKGSPYDAFMDNAEKVAAAFEQKNGDSAEKVAATIFKAATDGSRRLRYPVGGGSPLFLFLRKLFPERLFYWIVRKNYKM